MAGYRKLGRTSSQRKAIDGYLGGAGGIAGG